jgi:hypothetical protein
MRQAKSAPIQWTWLTAVSCCSTLIQSAAFESLEDLLDTLAVGGVAALHVPSFKKMSPMKEMIYQAKRRVPGAILAFNLLQGKKLLEPHMAMNNYSLDKVLTIYLRKRMSRIVILPTANIAYNFIVIGQREP